MQEMIEMIKKFRKKPVVIEAVQWDGTEKSALYIVRWMNGNSMRFERVAKGMAKVCAEVGKIDIHTKEGVITAIPYNWIIKGIVGEFYPCRADIFEQTYEEVEE